MIRIGAKKEVKANIAEPIREGIKSLVEMIIEDQNMRDLQEWGIDNAVEMDNEGNINLDSLDVPQLQEIYHDLEIMAFGESTESNEEQGVDTEGGEGVKASAKRGFITCNASIDVNNIREALKKLAPNATPTEIEKALYEITKERQPITMTDGQPGATAQEDADGFIYRADISFLKEDDETIKVFADEDWLWDVDMSEDLKEIAEDTAWWNLDLNKHPKYGGTEEKFNKALKKYVPKYKRDIEQLVTSNPSIDIKANANSLWHGSAEARKETILAIIDQLKVMMTEGQIQSREDAQEYISEEWSGWGLTEGDINKILDATFPNNRVKANKSGEGMQAIMVRKASNVDGWKQEANHWGAETSPVVIEKTIEISEEEFRDLCEDFFEDRKYITENIDHMYMQDGVWHCLLVKSPTSKIGILIESEGYDYARYTSVIDLKDVRAGLERKNTVAAGYNGYYVTVDVFGDGKYYYDGDDWYKKNLGDAKIYSQSEAQQMVEDFNKWTNDPIMSFAIEATGENQKSIKEEVDQILEDDGFILGEDYNWKEDNNWIRMKSEEAAERAESLVPRRYSPKKVGKGVLLFEREWDEPNAIKSIKANPQKKKYKVTFKRTGDGYGYNTKNDSRTIFATSEEDAIKKVKERVEDEFAYSTNFVATEITDNSVKASYQEENKAQKALQWIVETNGGLTKNQIDTLYELIEGGYAEAIDDHNLIIHN